MKKQVPANKPVVLDSGALSEIIRAATQPRETFSEQQQRLEMEKSRHALALSSEQERKNREKHKLTCPHRRSNGTTTCVYVDGSHYLICQRCQCRIRPESDKHLPAEVYDTALFNQLWGSTQSADIWG